MDEASAHELIDRDRRQTVSRILALTDALDDIVAAAQGANLDDEHDPEGSTVAFERAQVTALLIESETHLGELERATASLAAHTYGSCERCALPIAPERLMARPTARTCVGCASPEHPRPGRGRRARDRLRREGRW